jgi:hypothetical protein
MKAVKRRQAGSSDPEEAISEIQLSSIAVLEFRPFVVTPDRNKVGNFAAEWRSANLMLDALAPGLLVWRR